MGDLDSDLTSPERSLGGDLLLRITSGQLQSILTTVDFIKDTLENLVELKSVGGEE